MKTLNIVTIKASLVAPKELPTTELLKKTRLQVIAAVAKATAVRAAKPLTMSQLWEAHELHQSNRSFNELADDFIMSFCHEPYVAHSHIAAYSFDEIVPTRCQVNGM